MNAAIVAGATLVLMARWDKDLIPDLFEAHGVTFWNAAPTHDRRCSLQRRIP